MLAFLGLQPCRPKLQPKLIPTDLELTAARKPLGDEHVVGLADDRAVLVSAWLTPLTHQRHIAVRVDALQHEIRVGSNIVNHKRRPEQPISLSNPYLISLRLQPVLTLHVPLV